MNQSPDNQRDPMNSLGVINGDPHANMDGDNVPQFEKISVSKLDAARRQLETAIPLWFTGGDPVSILTLAAASHSIIESLLKIQGQSTRTFDERLINPTHRKEYLTAVIKARNFFKHADRDPNEVLDFTVRQCDWFLWDGVMGYLALGAKPTSVLTAFLVRLACESDGLLTMDEELMARLPPDLIGLKVRKESFKPLIKFFAPLYGLPIFGA